MGEVLKKLKLKDKSRAFVKEDVRLGNRGADGRDLKRRFQIQSNVLLMWTVFFCRHGSTALAQLEPTDAPRRHPQVGVGPVVAGTRIPEEGIPGPIMAEGGQEGETATSTCTQWTTGATSNTISLLKFDFHLRTQISEALKLAWNWNCVGESLNPQLFQSRL